MGYGVCEPREEGILQCTKRYCIILRKIKNVGGGAIFEPKTFSMYLKKKETKKSKRKKKMTEPGFEPTTSGLEKNCSLIH